MRHKLTRDFYIPTDSRKVTREGIDAEVYCHENQRGKFCAMGFWAKISKPTFYFAFATDEKRSAHIETFFNSRKQSQEYKENRRKMRVEFTTSLQPGDLLHGSWGYDQTNPEFAEVVEVTGPRSVIIREVACETSSSEGVSPMAEYVRPVQGKYIGPPIKKLVLPGDSIKFNDHCYLSKTAPDKQHYHSWYA